MVILIGKYALKIRKMKVFFCAVVRMGGQLTSKAKYFPVSDKTCVKELLNAS